MFYDLPNLIGQDEFKNLIQMNKYMFHLGFNSDFPFKIETSFLIWLNDFLSGMLILREMFFFWRSDDADNGFVFVCFTRTFVYTNKLYSCYWGDLYQFYISWFWGKNSFFFFFINRRKCTFRNTLRCFMKCRKYIFISILRSLL